MTHGEDRRIRSVEIILRDNVDHVLAAPAVDRGWATGGSPADQGVRPRTSACATAIMS